MMMLLSFSYHSWAFPIYVIRNFTTAESYGAISDGVYTVINKSSRTALECALRCECRAKKTVKSL